MTRNHPTIELQALQTRRSAWHVIIGNVVRGNRLRRHTGGEDFICICTASAARTSYFFFFFSTPDGCCGAHGLGAAGDRWNGLRDTPARGNLRALDAST